MSGTCKMAPSTDPMAVVDPRLKVNKLNRYTKLFARLVEHLVLLGRWNVEFNQKFLIFFSYPWLEIFEIFCLSVWLTKYDVYDNSRTK